MIIIGEKINGTRKSVAEAIRNRDAEFIRELARVQAEAGSAYLDVNAGTPPERESEDMVWLVETIQAGLNSVIINPNDRELIGAIMTAELLMNQDRYCMNFTRAYRAGTIG